MKKETNNNEVESSRQIKMGAMISYLGIALNIVAGLLYTPWMINQIGQANFGLYTLAISLIGMFLIDFGLGAAVSRFTSKFLAEGKQDRVNKMLGITYKVYILIDALILIILVLVFFNIDIIYQELTPIELTRFKVVYVIAALFSIITFPFLTLNGILTSYEKFIQLKFCDLLNKVISITLIVIALLNGYGLYALVAANAFSGLVVILLKLLIVNRQTPIKVEFTYYSKSMTKEIFSFSAWSGVTAISQRFIFNITPSILGAVSGSVNIAIFGIAASLEGYIYTIASALNGLFLPKISRLIKKENFSNYLLLLMIKVGRIQFIIIGLIVTGFILLGQDFIFLWVGDDYIKAYYATILLIVPSLIYLPQQIGNTAILALNKVKLQAYVFITMALINIVLSVAFSWMWGIIGASLAIFISYSIRNIGMNIIYYKSLKINIFKFFMECHIKLLPPILITIILNLLLFQLFNDLTWLNILFKGNVLVFSYLILMWLFGFNQYEKKLLINTTLQIFQMLKNIIRR